MSRTQSIARPLTLPVLALGAWLLAAASAPAEGLLTPLRYPLTNLAEKIKDIVGDQAVTVGEFAPPADGEAAGGPGIQQILIEELQAAKVRVEKGADAPLEIDGRFRMAKNPDANNEEQLLVQVSVVDKASGDEKGKFKAFVYDAAALIPAYGASGTTRNDNNGSPRKAIPASIAHPAVYVNDSIVKTTEDSPYSLQVFIKENDPTTDQPRYTPCPAREQNGQAHIDLDVGQVYVVFVTNKSEDKVGVQLYIDGLDAFTLQEERNPTTGMPFARMIADPGKSVTIEGWFHTRNSSREFRGHALRFGGGVAPARDVGQDRHDHCGLLSGAAVLRHGHESGAVRGRRYGGGNQAGQGSRDQDQGGGLQCRPAGRLDHRSL